MLSPVAHLYAIVSHETENMKGLCGEHFYTFAKLCKFQHLLHYKVLFLDFSILTFDVNLHDLYHHGNMATPLED